MKLRDQPTSLRHLRIWFSKACIHIPAEKRQKAFKIKPRAWIGYLVGYEGENGYLYRIYDLAQNKVSIHRDIVFWESDDKQFKQDLEEITENIKEFSFQNDTNIGIRQPIDKQTEKEIQRNKRSRLRNLVNERFTEVNTDHLHELQR